VEKVLERWGGREAISTAIEELIRGFQPEIVVCSDSNPDAYEHFEHKAVGLITRDVVLDLKGQGFEAVKGFLVSVDPFQDLYEELIRLDLMDPHPKSGYTYREIQVAALKEHQTQGDSSLIGVELLPNFGWEQYLPVYWDLEVSLEEYLSSG
jgi:LmbE family N-acetylglucosaminyl deacetylase